VAVHPKTGELYVSTGGRGTRGGVYRIRCDKGGDPDPKPIAVKPRSLERKAGAAAQWIADAIGADAAARRRSLEVLTRWWDQAPRERFLYDALLANLAHYDPLIRAAAGRAVIRTATPIGQPTDPQVRATLALAEVGRDLKWALDTATDLLTDPRASSGVKLQAVRVVQLAYGDLTARDAVGTVWEGYTFRRPPPRQPDRQLIDALGPLLGSDDPALFREAARTLAAFGTTPGGARAYDTYRVKTDSDDPMDSLHHLICYTRIYGSRYVAADVAVGLMKLDDKLRSHKITPDRHWPMRVEELATAAGEHSYKGADALATHPQFGRPKHLLLVTPFGVDPRDAARRFIGAATRDADYGWTAGIVKLIGVALPEEESRPVLRKLWDRGGLEDALIPLFARQPLPADRAKFVAGLRSLDPAVIHAAAGALAALPTADDPAELAAAIRALRRLPDDKAAAAAREKVTALLRARTGQTFAADPKAWAAWFAQAHPAHAAKLAGTDGFDADAWKTRAAAIDWAAGDPTAGKTVFAKATCAACHDGGRAIGPSLQGVAKRFGRDDLLTAVVDPNRDVSPSYRPTRVTTADGKAFTGMIVYEATDGVILQTGPDTTVRVAGSNIEVKRTLDTSLMPAGLLDKLTDREVADLLAYLRTLDDLKPK
jgi:putative heme-binding domain-containing protein